MSDSRKYRPYLALFLLVLYVFIATPVQWWHHHPVAKAENTVAGKGIGKAGIDASTSTHVTASDCPLCSHQYSVYYTDPSTPERIAVPVFPSPAVFRLTALFETPPSVLSNKSPPDCLLNGILNTKH